MRSEMAINRRNPGLLYLHLLLGFAGAYVVSMITTEYLGMGGENAQLVVIVYFIAFLASFLLFKNHLPAKNGLEKQWLRGI